MTEYKIDLKFVELEMAALDAELTNLQSKKQALIEKIQAGCEHLNTYDEVTHCRGGYDYRGYDNVKNYCRDCGVLRSSYARGDYGYE
jgi:uncharacterized protein (DUF983 family)